jgi:hypothetical protein
MTQKDYVALARALNETRPADADASALATWTATLDAVAAVLAADNPRFNADRFYTAAALNR